MDKITIWLHSRGKNIICPYIFLLAVAPMQFYPHEHVTLK